MPSLPLLAAAYNRAAAHCDQVPQADAARANHRRLAALNALTDAQTKADLLRFVDLMDADLNEHTEPIPLFPASP